MLGTGAVCETWGKTVSPRTRTQAQTPVTLALCPVNRGSFDRGRKKQNKTICTIPWQVSEKGPTGLDQGKKMKERKGAIVLGGPPGAPALGRASRVADTAERRKRKVISKSDRQLEWCYFKCRTVPDSLDLQYTSVSLQHSRVLGCSATHRGCHFLSHRCARNVHGFVKREETTENLPDLVHVIPALSLHFVRYS